jgi:hypothetical protein
MWLMLSNFLPKNNAKARADPLSNTDKSVLFRILKEIIVLFEQSFLLERFASTSVKPS